MPRKVTIEDMVRAVRDAGRPCTKQDIADRTDVSRQTIANHADELEQHPSIEYGQVGPSKAYWLSDPLPEADERARTAFEDSVDDKNARSTEKEPPERETRAGDEKPPGEPTTADDPEQHGTRDGAEDSPTTADMGALIEQLIKQLASRRAWGISIGLVLLSVVLAAAATTTAPAVVAAVLAHLARISGVVGLGGLFLGALAVRAVRAAGNGADVGTAAPAGETA